MSTGESEATATMFDALLASLQKAGDYHRDDTVPPAAILWPDEKRDWERIVPRLRMALPHFLVFGPYNKANRSGPAIWLRCVLAGKIPDIVVPKGSVPIVYLPGVSRATIRATEECPQELKPLAELQYRGVFWSQVNAKDWTVTAFLQTNHGGLQLKIARDNATTTSARRALEKLLDVPVAELRAKALAGELNSAYFDSLVSEDLVDDLLSWLADPKGTRDRWESGRWETLCSRCVTDYGFDPARDGELVGAEKLGLQEKSVWKTAWKRFAAAPHRYAALAELLKKAKPAPKQGDLFASVAVESWPQDNEAEEDKLRGSLANVDQYPVAEARRKLIELEAASRHRRQWIWARLNRAPLAQAVEHLATLAEVTQVALTGATVSDMARGYTEGGWKADAAVLDALAAATQPPDREAVGAAIEHIYSPWLRDAAELFQEHVKQQPLPGKDTPRLAEVPVGVCIVFVDGLRFDVAQKLRSMLEPKTGKVRLEHQFVALPSVTPTAKPAVSPIAGRIAGSDGGDEFRPCIIPGDKELTPDRFRTLMEAEGYQVLAAAGTGNPAGRAWTEYGNLDSVGHQEGSGLAQRISDLLSCLVYRVESLLAAGWREVRIVTDHGWLLLPGGLPKTDLPKYLTGTRWRRCAVVKESAHVDVPCFSWFWADKVRIACPPGIDCFIAGEEYSHGGLSLQECVVPQLTLVAGAQPAVTANIEAVKWAGLRCRVKVAGQFAGCMADLRDKAADPSTSLAGAKAIGSDGSVSLVVQDDTREGSATTLVLLDAAGNVVNKTLVTVGG